MDSYAPAHWRSTSVDETPQKAAGSGRALCGLVVTNENSTAVYLKFYDKAAASDVTVGTTVPVMVLPCFSEGFLAQYPTGKVWKKFTNGIVVAATTGAADNDATAPTSDIHVELFFS